MVWSQIGNLAIILTLCGMAWRAGQIIMGVFHFVIGMNAHMIDIKSEIGDLKETMERFLDQCENERRRG